MKSMIKTNITINNLLQETEGEEFYFRDFLRAALNVGSAYIVWPLRGITGENKKEIQCMYERVFAYELYHQFRKIMENDITQKYKGFFFNGEPCKDNSTYSKILQQHYANLEETDNVPDCFPDMVLHKDLDRFDSDKQYFLCEIKTSKNRDFLGDFEKINKLFNSKLNFRHYIFLSIGEDINSLIGRIRDKHVDLNNYYHGMMCICLHSDGKSLDYATLGEIIQEIKPTIKQQAL